MEMLDMLTRPKLDLPILSSSKVEYVYLVISTLYTGFKFYVLQYKHKEPTLESNKDISILEL